MKKKLAVKNARDLGILFKDNNVNMIGQDAAYSIPIHANEIFWGFGDTFVGSFDETGRRILKAMPSNTGLICSSKNPAEGLGDFKYFTDNKNQLRQLIPFEADEGADDYRVWGMHGCYIEEKFYWFYIRVRILEQGCWPFKFKVTGSGLATANYPEFCFSRIRQNDDTMIWGKHEPCFGVAVLPIKADNFVYIYGTYLKEGRHFCKLARVPFDSVGIPSYYEYLTSPKPAWSHDLGKATSIMADMPTEMSVSYNNYLGCYLAVHSLEVTGKIVGRTADKPWGRWSEPVVLWTSKIGLRNPLVYGGPVVYAGKEHAEYSQGKGKIIYLTCVEFEEYYPRLIEVELK